jgi:hypothetical protein
VSGPGWLDQNEYDIDARAEGPADRERLAVMLRTLLAERFRLTLHSEIRSLRLYELVVDKGGPKIRPIGEGSTAAAGHGFVVRGDMQRFADLLAVQLSIAVPDDPARPGRASGLHLRSWIERPYRESTRSRWISGRKPAPICSRFGGEFFRKNWDSG